MEFLKFFVFFVSLIFRADGIQSLRFFVIGDMGGIPITPYYTYVERSTAEEMGKLADVYDPKFILELGDNFYEIGVTSSSDKRFKLTFEDVYTAKSLQVPWYFIAGNHDHYGNVSAQIAYSNISQRWNFPDFYYYLEKTIPGGKTVGLVMIDTVILCGNTDDSFASQPQGPFDKSKALKQWKFIHESLKNSKADYLFTAGHFPVYSVAEHGPTKCLVDDLLPLLHKYGVNGHLSGHDHNLQHLRIKSTSDRVKNIDFFVSGMANYINLSVLHNDTVPSDSRKFHYADAFSSGGFLYVEALPKNMTLTFVNAKGERLYSSIVFPRN